jgi:hypothetical protein
MMNSFGGENDLKKVFASGLDFDYCNDSQSVLLKALLLCANTHNVTYIIDHVVWRCTVA